MTYQPSKGPRVVVGAFAAIVLGFFAYDFLSVWIPVAQGKYQNYRLERCAEQHPVANEQWEVRFAFDYSERHLTGTSEMKQALIDCILDTQDVGRITPSESGDYSGNPPRLVIGQSSFSHIKQFSYYSRSP